MEDPDLISKLNEPYPRIVMRRSGHLLLLDPQTAMPIPSVDQADALSVFMRRLPVGHQRALRVALMKNEPVLNFWDLIELKELLQTGASS